MENHDEKHKDQIRTIIESMLFDNLEETAEGLIESQGFDPELTARTFQAYFCMAKEAGLDLDEYQEDIERFSEIISTKLGDEKGREFEDYLKMTQEEDQE